MNWHKIQLVMRREYVSNFRKPSFLFTAFGVPLVSLVAMFFVMQLTIDRENSLDNFQRIGYVDRAQLIDPAVPSAEAYVAINDPALTIPSANSDPAELTAYYDALEQFATQQVLDDELDGYFVLDEQYVLSGQVTLYTEKNTPEQLLQNIEAFLTTQIVAKAPDTLAVPVERLNNDEYTLRDLDSGDEMSDAALMGRLMLPFVFVMLYFMSTNTTAQFLMSGVVAEKENRLMEILATSIRPIELLWGKLLGLGTLALTQIVLWVIGGLLIALINDSAREFITGTTFAAGDIFLLIGLFVINFLLFASVLLSIGASVTAEAESRQFASFFTLLSILPLMLLTLYFTDPNGPIPVLLSFIPFTAATSLILRIGLGALPTWQLVASVVLQMISVLVVMWLGAKIFRMGMLMYGKRLNRQTLIEALRQGQTMLTSAGDETIEVSATKKRKGWLRR